MQMILSDIVQPLSHGSDFSGDDTLHGNMDHVIDEYAENQQRIAEGYDRTGVRPIALHGQTGQCEADERGTAIAQKDHSRPDTSKIIRKKPEARAVKPPTPEQALARRILASARRNSVGDVRQFALRGCSG